NSPSYYDLMQPYVKNDQIFVCPSNTRIPNTNTVNLQTTTPYYSRQFSYGINNGGAVSASPASRGLIGAAADRCNGPGAWGSCASWSGIYPLNETRYKQPSLMVYAGDSWGDTGGQNF